MLKTVTGSAVQDTLLTTAEAAKMLGVGERMIRHYVTSKTLQRYSGKDKSKIYVSMQELAAVANLRCSTSVADIARVATAALARAANAEDRLQRIESLLGIDLPRLLLDEEAITAFHLECKELLGEYTEGMAAEEVLNWAYRFSAITEEYLRVVETVTGDKEPWAVFMTAAQKIADSAPRSSFNFRRDLEAAYGYLSSARLHLRQVAYFFIRGKHGIREANRACPEQKTADRDNKIIRLIFMMKGSASTTTEEE